MALDIAVMSESFPGNEDRSWARSKHGFQTCRSVTLDVSTFQVDHLTAKGAIPSGCVLGKITATGKYGPYGGNAAEVQQLVVDASGGTYTITFDGETTAAIANNATASTVQQRLEALDNVNPGDVTVTGGVGAAGGGTPYVLTWGGRYVGANVPQPTTTATLTGGATTATFTTTTSGGSAVSDGRELAEGLLFNTTRVGPLMGPSASGSLVNLNTAADVGAPLMWQGIVSRSRLPAFANTVAGELDAAAEARLVHIRFEA